MSKMSTKMNDTMMRVMEKLTPTCQVVAERISDSMERKLTMRERIGVKVHLLGCDLCERYKRQMLSLQELLKQYSLSLEKEENLPDVKLDINAREKISQALKHARE